ncbi:MAG: hypothetical protein QMD01_03980 [Thermodesulfovibrionales bacterium]|nr:hypothetical protein [Thermodesulfovibrionales bacterium]
MKDKVYTDIICKEFCKYYKGGKETLFCKGYELLRNNLTPSELKMLAASLKACGDIKNSIPAKSNELTKLVCRRCDFFIDGCDFAESRSGAPCGGYLIIKRLSFLSLWYLHVPQVLLHLQ